jgi:hypothetical protein
MSTREDIFERNVTKMNRLLKAIFAPFFAPLSDQNT